MKEVTTIISKAETAIVRVLAYYHIFHHPLTTAEIAKKAEVKGITQGETSEILEGLQAAGVISEHQGYYFLPDSDSIVKRRQEGELRAQKLLKKAQRMSRIIYAFPFVRAVLISGSLSKGTVPEDADIDYFIVTKKNRLWIARTLLVLFKRVFLLGSKKYFCVNYFVDEDHLEIPDKNIFTATEVSTLIPLRGKRYCEKFADRNSWYQQFHPNISFPIITSEKTGFFKRVSMSIVEALFFHSLAEKLEKYFMKKTYARWMSMYGGGYSDKEFELAFRTHRGTSKNHDKNYQKRVLNTVEEHVKQTLGRLKPETVD